MAWRLAVTTILVVAATFASPVFTALDGGCAAIVTGVHHVSRIAQDDAGSGADAGDARAVALEFTQEGYFWGYLDPVELDGADREDWYAARLLGDGETVMLEVVDNYTTSYSYAPAMPWGFVVEAWPPGADGPSLLATPDDGRVAFENHVAGLWHFRLRIEDAPGARACPATSATLVDAGSPAASETTRNHGLYFGCHPICLDQTSIAS
jgi:hypothetical protein